MVVIWRRSCWISIPCGRRIACNLPRPWSGANSVPPGGASSAGTSDWPKPQSQLDSQFSNFQELFPERSITPLLLQFLLRLSCRRYIFLAVFSDASMITSSCVLRPAVQSTLPIRSRDRHLYFYSQSAPALFREPAILAGLTTSTLIRATSAVQVHPGPPSNRRSGRDTYDLSELIRARQWSLREGRWLRIR